MIQKYNFTPGETCQGRAVAAAEARAGGHTGSAALDQTPKNVKSGAGICPDSLDTLAQLGTDQNLLLNSVTSEADKTALLKRARAKFLGSSIVLRLVDLPSPLTKSYWNSYHCCSTLVEHSGKVSGKYCKNRWCLVCNRIRTARLIQSYRPTLLTWTDRHFLTLTIPNVPSVELRITVKIMHREFKKMIEQFKKQYQRNGYCKVEGVRKFECTYNSTRNDFHPHFHVICKDAMSAYMLREEWLKRFPDANMAAQDIREADENDCIELFKYFTKLISKPSKANERLTISPEALDMIFQSIIGVRTFQPFGFRLPKQTEDDQEDLEQTEQITAAALDEVVYTWEQQFSDWISPDGVCLSGYEVSPAMKKLVQQIDVIRK